MAQSGHVVGRRAELDRIRRFMEASWDGPGSLAVVVGEPGAGKTSLVRAAIAEAGATSYWGRAADEPGTPPLRVWDQVLRAAHGSGAIGDDEWSALRRRDGAASAARRFRRFERYAEALRSLTATPRPVVVLDDVQWADTESMALLAHVVAELGSLRLAVILTARAGHDPLPVRPDVSVELGGLRGDELAELFASVVGVHPDASLLDTVERATGGNPYFVIETAHASHDAQDPSSWRATPTSGVRTVLSSALNRLSTPTRQLIDAAAVLGTTFDMTVATAVADLDRDDAWDHVASAVDERVLRRLDGGQVAFIHDLVREVALAELDEAQRRRMHARAADVVAATSGERAAAAVATHLLAAGRIDEARRWSRAAGDQAMSGAMFTTALHWYERCADGGGRLEAADEIRRAEALARSGAWDEAQQAFHAVARSARASGDVDLFARAALGIGTIGGGFEVRVLEPTQLDLLDEAIGGLPATDSPLRVQLLARLSVASALSTSHERRAELAEQAVAMARRLEDDGLVAVALGAWCDAHAGPAAVDRRLEASEEMLGAALRAGDPDLELLARRLRIVALMESGDLPRSWREIDAFNVAADALHQPVFRWFGRLVLGMRAHFEGDLELAERHAGEALELGRAAGSSNATMLVAGALLPAILRDRGDPTWAVHLRTITADHPESARGVDVATLYSVGYDADDALVRDVLRSLGAVEETVPATDALHLQALTMVGNAAAFVGDRDLAATIDEALEPFDRLWVLDGTASVCFGPVVLTRARLAATLGRDDADDLFGRAVVALRATGGRLLLARVERERSVLGGGPAPTDEADRVTAELRRQGEVWTVGYLGESATVRHLKGMDDLCVLLTRPGVEVSALDLVDHAEGRAARSGRNVNRDLGPQIDATARARYEARIRELTELMDEADERNDDEALARFDAEREALLSQLAGALGLAGRARPQGSDVERARKAVTMRVRDAIARLGSQAPGLGRHLTNSVHTGTACVYRPERDVVWRVETGD